MATALWPHLPWYGARRLCGAHPWFGARMCRAVRWYGAARWFGVAAAPQDSALYGDRRLTRPVAWSGALRRTPTGHFPRLIRKNNFPCRLPFQELPLELCAKTFLPQSSPRKASEDAEEIRNRLPAGQRLLTSAALWKTT